MFSVKFKSSFSFPRSAWDIGSLSFLVITIPLIFWFETCIVIPVFYPYFGFWWLCHLCLAVFLMFQIVTNFLFVILVDSSVQTISGDVNNQLNFCHDCKSLVPPRSFHCQLCKVCILKRDHHCRFSACCIGHYNHRYFMMFLLYLTIATIYASYFNLFFILNYINFNLLLLLKVLLPIAFLIFGVDASTNHCYLIMFIIVIIGSVISLLLLVYHFGLVQDGLTTYERNHNLKGYNLGFKKNIEHVFGSRWHLVWIAPFINSPLPLNGVDWDLEINKNEKSL